MSEYDTFGFGAILDKTGTIITICKFEYVYWLLSDKLMNFQLKGG